MSAPGDLLADRYELLSRLGRGGMAEVFRAHDRRLDRQVAVKVLAPHLLADARSVDRFEREARAAASLNHPNIVNVYDAITEGDTHAIVMELVEGPTLDDVISREGRLSIERATRIAIGIADALQAAHDRGLVHHDVKPRNVLFDHDEALKVTDFGIARAASSDITTVQGSPPYLAPEQARGGRSDRRSDVYALGCVLFEMLTGRPPFEGDSSSAVVMKHIDEPAPKVSRLRPDVPRDLETVVERSLAKDPDERYDSAAALRAELTRLAEGLSPAGATIVSSTRAMPRDTTMALDDEWADTPAYDTRRSEAPSRDRRRGVSARGVAITLGVLLLVLVLAMAWADSSGRETAQADPVASEAARDTDAQPVPEPDNRSPADPAPPGETGDGGDQNLIDRLNRRADRLEQLLERGRNVDEATQDRIDQLREELERAVQQPDADGGADGGGQEGPSAQERLDELQRRIDDLTEAQRVTEGIVERLRDILNNLNPFDGG